MHITDRKNFCNLAGLRLQLSTCCWCGSDTARVGDGTWQRPPFTCDGCGIERGRLEEQVQRFILEFIKLIGRPTSPIKITEPLLQPFGAPATASTAAPVNAKLDGD